MNQQELRVWLDKHFCGCGEPEEAVVTIRKLLSLHPLYVRRKELESWIPDAGIRYLLLYWLDRQGLTEHGSYIDGAWLTEKGKELLHALEQVNDLQSLFEAHCVHGFTAAEMRSHICPRRHK